MLPLIVLPLKTPTKPPEVKITRKSKPFLPVSLGKDRMSQGLENRGSLISVLLALSYVIFAPSSRMGSQKLIAGNKP